MTNSKTTFAELEGALDTAFFKVLSEPARVELIKVLIRLRNADIGTIASHVSQDRSVVSRHLKAMSEAGLVCAEKDGKHCCYCLNGEGFVEKLESILEVVKNATSKGCC